MPSRPRLRRRRIRALLATVAVAPLAVALFAGPASAASSTSLSNVTLNVGVFNSVYKQIWAAAGLNQNLPFKLNWVVDASFGEGSPIFTAMKAGSVDVASDGDLPMIAGIAADAPIKLVANGISPDESILQLLVPTGSQIKNASDLKGKTVVTAQLSGTQYLVDSYLTEHHVPIPDVTFSFVQPTDALPAFESGKVEAWASYVPYTTQVLDAKKATVLANGNGDGHGRFYPGLDFQVVYAPDLSNSGKAAAIKIYEADEIKINTWTENHLSQAAAIYAKAYDVPVALGKTFAEGTTAKWGPINKASIAALQKIANNAHTYGMIPSKVSVAPYFDSAFNGVVAKAQGG